MKCSILIAVALCAFFPPAAALSDDLEQQACQGTHGMYGHDALRTVLPGKLIFRPGGLGFVDQDGPPRGWRVTT